MLALPCLQILLRVLWAKYADSSRATTTRRPSAKATAWEEDENPQTQKKIRARPEKMRTHLLRVHEAVVVQVAVVGREAGGEAAPQAAAQAGVALDVLAHHQHGVVERALGALGRRVHPDHEDDVHDDLQETRGETGHHRERLSSQAPRPPTCMGGEGLT